MQGGVNVESVFGRDTLFGVEFWSSEAHYVWGVGLYKDDVLGIVLTQNAVLYEKFEVFEILRVSICKDVDDQSSAVRPVEARINVLLPARK